MGLSDHDTVAAAVRHRCLEVAADDVLDRRAFVGEHALDELARDNALSGSGSRPRRTPVFISDDTVTRVGVPQTRSRRE
jgi:hypothetical protein